MFHKNRNKNLINVERFLLNDKHNGNNNPNSRNHNKFISNRNKKNNNQNSLNPLKKSSSQMSINNSYLNKTYIAFKVIQIKIHCQ